MQDKTEGKPDTKLYPVFDGTLPKYKGFKDRFFAVATSQQMVKLLTSHYK